MSITIHVAKDGSVSLDGEKIDQAELVRRLDALAQENPQPAVAVTADAQADYDVLARVFELLEASRLDKTKIGVIGGT